MTIAFNVKTNLKAFEKQLSVIAKKQIPFAAAQALTAIAKEVVAEEQRNERDVLDRPKPFTVNAIGVRRATKASLKATVYMRDIAASYLDSYEFGGKNKLNSKALLKPVGAKADLDQYGNLSRNYLKKLLSRSDVFVGPVRTKTGIVNGVWMRAGVEDGYATQTTVTKRGKVVVRKVPAYVSSRDGRQLKLMIKFEDAHDVTQHLDWFALAQRVVAKTFNREMVKALADAIATAR
jgi:hypothetical protein